MVTLGFIGVGHLAGYIIQGLDQSRWPKDKIILSPRGASTELAARYDLTIAASNAEVVERSDSVILGVRPAQARSAVDGLPWRAGQIIVSVCAGVALDSLRSVTAPAELVRAMPISAVSLGDGPTALFPDHPVSRLIFERLGSVLPLTQEEHFDIASVNAALYGWVHDLIRQSATWSTKHGLDAMAARRLAAATFVAAGRMVLANEKTSLDDMLDGLATPGGITARGLSVLTTGRVPENWSAACDEVMAFLRGTAGAGEVR